MRDIVRKKRGEYTGRNRNTLIDSQLVFYVWNGSWFLLLYYSEFVHSACSSWFCRLSIYIFCYGYCFFCLCFYFVTMMVTNDGLNPPNDYLLLCKQTFWMNWSGIHIFASFDNEMTCGHSIRSLFQSFYLFLSSSSSPSYSRFRIHRKNLR